MRYDIEDTGGIDRLFKLIDQRAGHWLAMEVEETKIQLTHTDWDQHRKLTPTLIRNGRETDQPIAALLEQFVPAFFGEARIQVVVVRMIGVPEWI